jgi:single-strand DNA-binding protein
MATNRRWKDKNGELQEETQWHNIVAWGSQAEFLATYLKKGSKVFIEGRLTHRSWDDQQGQKRYMTEVVVEQIVLVEGAPEGARGGRPPVPPPPEPPESAPSGGEEEDVPF